MILCIFHFFEHLKSNEQMLYNMKKLDFFVKICYNVSKVGLQLASKGRYIEMKKLLTLLMLLTVMIFNGCENEVTENEQEYESQAEQYDLENEEDLQVEQYDLYEEDLYEEELYEEDHYVEQYYPDDEEEEQIYYSPQTRESRFNFNVTAGEHGYLAVQWIEHMNDYLPNRLAFTDRELATAEWIVETLLEMGFGEHQVEMQTFRYDTPTSTWWGDASRMMEMYVAMGHYDGLERIDYSQNVILTIPGRSEETIIIGAHYDSIGVPGISDNAGGTVLLLENAYRMRNADNYYTLQYVFFGAEEVGLIGAFYFVDNLTEEDIDNLVLMINADATMDGPSLVYGIGYIEELPHNPMSVMFEESEILQNSLSEQVKEIADQLNAGQRTELTRKPYMIVFPSDQLAFLQFSIPVMMLYGTHPVEFHVGFDGDLYHSERDCLDFIMTNHPGRVEHSLHGFGVFLEEVLSSEFTQ